MLSSHYLNAWLLNPAEYEPEEKVFIDWSTPNIAALKNPVQFKEIARLYKLWVILNQSQYIGLQECILNINQR